MFKHKHILSQSIAGCAVALLLGGCSDDGESTTGAAGVTRAADQTIDSPSLTIGSTTNASTASPAPASSSTSAPKPAPAAAPAPKPAPAPPPTTTKPS